MCVCVNISIRLSIVCGEQDVAIVTIFSTMDRHILFGCVDSLEVECAPIEMEGSPVTRGEGVHMRTQTSCREGKATPLLGCARNFFSCRKEKSI